MVEGLTVTAPTGVAVLAQLLIFTSSSGPSANDTVKPAVFAVIEYTEANPSIRPSAVKISFASTSMVTESSTELYPSSTTILTLKDGTIVTSVTIEQVPMLESPSHCIGFPEASNQLYVNSSPSTSKAVPVKVTVSPAITELSDFREIIVGAKFSTVTS